jgi:parvulin-like peptidyl-prolyl isomerase
MVGAERKLMRDLRLITVTAILALLFTAPSRASDEGKGAGEVASGPTVLLKVPVVSEALANVPVAMVGDEAVTLKELNESLAASHEGGGAKPPPRISPMDLVNRLVNAKLILRESRNIGLDEMPEVKNMVDTFSKDALRQLLIEDLTKSVVAEKAEAEQLFRDAVKEYKIRSLIFDKEEDAQQLEADLKAGKEFDELLSRAVQDGKAKGDSPENYLKPKELQPDIARAVGKLAVGAVSEPVSIPFGGKTGFVVLRLEDVRYPEDPAVREQVERTALGDARAKVAETEKKKLIKQYVKYRKKTLDALDFEAKKPGLEALLKDKRVVAEIQGEKPITVADLAEALRQRFYHGPEQAITEKRINKKKTETLDSLVEKSLFHIVALKRGIDKTPRYKDMVKEYEESVVFGAFIQKAVIPDVKVTDEDLRAYYEEKKSEYTFPEMIRLKGIAFNTTARAQEALEKLQRGADFNWTRANAEGRVNDDAKVQWKFEEGPLFVKDLPEEVRKAVSGAKPGDFRLANSPDGLAYVLVVDDVIPSGQQPFEEVQADLRGKLFRIRLNKAVEDWAAKLRAASHVEVYLTEGAK